MPRPNETLEFAKRLHRDGVASMHLRLNAEQVKELRAAESKSHDDAVKILLELLRTRWPPAGAA